MRAFPLYALCLSILASTGLVVQAQETRPICETSTGEPGRLFVGMTATVIGPPGTKWALDASAFSIEEGFVPFDARTWHIHGSGIVTDFGIMVRPLQEGVVEINFFDEEKTRLLDSCRANIISFDLETHGLSALLGGTCPLTGDWDRALEVGEVRAFERPTPYGGWSYMGLDVAELESSRDRVFVTAVGPGVMNALVNTLPWSDPENDYGLCAVVVAQE